MSHHGNTLIAPLDKLFHEKFRRHVFAAAHRHGTPVQKIVGRQQGNHVVHRKHHAPGRARAQSIQHGKALRPSLPAERARRERRQKHPRPFPQRRDQRRGRRTRPMPCGMTDGKLRGKQRGQGAHDAEGVPAAHGNGGRPSGAYGIHGKTGQRGGTRTADRQSRPFFHPTEQRFSIHGSEYA